MRTGNWKLENRNWEPAKFFQITPLYSGLDSLISIFYFPVSSLLFINGDACLN